jgi:2,3-dihydroxybenzoate-AMP ligase
VGFGADDHLAGSIGQVDRTEATRLPPTDPAIAELLSGGFLTGGVMLEYCTPWPDQLVQDYLRRGYWKAESITDILEARARDFADRTFVSDASGRLSYGDVDRSAVRVALRLVDLGLGPRDIVLLQLPNIREFIIVFFALQKIGVIPVMCLPQHRGRELSYFAQLTGAKAHFFPQRFRNFEYGAMAKEVQAASPTLRYMLSTGDGTESGIAYLDPWIADEPREADVPRILTPRRPDPFEVAFMLLSGGTTGIPKLIPRTHVDYLCNAEECARVLRWGADSVFVIALPAAHNFPLGAPGMLAALVAGGSVALCASTDADTVFQAVEKQKGVFLGVSPALLIALLNSGARHKYDLSSLRFVYAGGQKMLPELVERTRATWNFVVPGHAFGMAEGLTNLTRPDDPWEVIRETQGRPVSAADEIRIVDDNGDEVPPGAVGELIARGPYTIRGYYKSAEYNRSAFTSDGFYRTGDMVRLHSSGNLVVEGRRKDLINRGGEKISAEEIENLMLGHDNIHMAAVVAMPDVVMGERCCAFVILKPGCSLTLEQLSKFLQEKRIAKFKLPERLEVVDSLPLTGMGKVSKKELREIIATKLDAERRISEPAAT